MSTTVDERQDNYGSPNDNFNNIAKLWMMYLSMRGYDVVIDERDVAWMMVLLKIARDTHKPIADNHVDVAGYAECARRIWENTVTKSTDTQPGLKRMWRQISSLDPSYDTSDIVTPKKGKKR